MTSDPQNTIPATTRRQAESGHRATVTVGGVTWTIHSRNERTTTVNGRHLFAGRCNPSRMWTLREMDAPGIMGRREIARHGNAHTAGLTALALTIPARQFFEVIEGGTATGNRLTLHVVSPAGVIEATFYGEQFRDIAEKVANSLNAWAVAA